MPFWYTPHNSNWLHSPQELLFTRHSGEFSKPGLDEAVLQICQSCWLLLITRLDSRQSSIMRRQLFDGNQHLEPDGGSPSLADCVFGYWWRRHLDSTLSKGHHRLSHGQGSSLIRRKHSTRLGKVARKMYGSRMPSPLKITRQFRHYDL